MVVVHGRNDVPPVDTVGCKGTALKRGFVNEDPSARRCQGGAVEVKVAKCGGPS